MRFPSPLRTAARAIAAAVVVSALLPAVHVTAALQAQVAGTGDAPRVTRQPVGRNAMLFAVHAVDTAVVWASGTAGTVLRTLDGGRTWTPRPVHDADALQFRDVHAFGADTAWVLAIGNGDASRIYRTTDGGASWTAQFVNTDSAAFYDCLVMLDARTGFVYGDATRGRTHVLRTADAGATWTLLPPEAVPAPLEGEGAYAASGRCVARGSATRAYVATGGPGSRLFVSDDAARTFRALETPFARGPSAGTSALAFTDAMRGAGVAGDMTALRTDTLRAAVAVTTDGGTTWTLRPRPPRPGALAGVAWVPGPAAHPFAETLVVTGFGGAFASVDGGRSWVVLTDEATTGVDATGRTAWLGGRGAILRVDF
jgi:photosystem II stability/assembly factor-like uncharacterized protein